MSILSYLIDALKRKFFSPVNYARSLGVKVGQNCIFYGVVWSSEPYLITIGDNCQITDGVKIFTHGGSFMFRKEIPDFDSFGKVVIKSDVYIGNSSLIMPGVTIGNNVLVAAGSVVTKSVPDNVCIGGNPARIICSIEDFKKNNQQYNVKTKMSSTKMKRNILLQAPDELLIKKDYT
jgi:acetyltransferase-like isoleucine patch superfamily enzyme